MWVDVEKQDWWHHEVHTQRADSCTFDTAEKVAKFCPLFDELNERSAKDYIETYMSSRVSVDESVMH